MTFDDVQYRRWMATAHENGHGLLSLADACRELAGLALPVERRDGLAELARSYQASRYPDAPSRGDASGPLRLRHLRTGIQIAEQTLADVEDAWSALCRSAEEVEGEVEDDSR